MKKLMFVVVLTSLMLFGIIVAVSADNGPHGGFTATTDACANCHRAHSAQVGSNSLLITSSAEALCTTCHNGSGAGTNVEDGVYSAAGATTAGQTHAEGADGKSLFGGGFKNALMATAWSGATAAQSAFNAVSAPTTSAHSLGVQGIVYGSGAVNASEATMALECTSCHDPHGNAGYQMTATYSATPGTANNGTWAAGTTKVPTYRLLRFQPQGSGSFTAPTSSNWSGGAFPASGTTSGWTVPDQFTTAPAPGTNPTDEWYTIGTAGAFAAGDYNAGNAANVYNVTTTDTGAVAAHNYSVAGSNVAYFCAQCHDRYFANSGLRNNTDKSAYCGAPVAGAVSGNITLTVYADADAKAPWIHPVDPKRCEPVVDAVTGALVSWGDNGGTGDTTHQYMHSSGDILRASADGSSMPASLAAMSSYVRNGTAGVGRTCVACHVAHGTSAAMTATAGKANQVFAETAVQSSVLLRMDNRALCLRCHGDAVGFTVAP